jgi:hypothetical protein
MASDSTQFIFFLVMKTPTFSRNIFTAAALTALSLFGTVAAAQNTKAMATAAERAATLAYPISAAQMNTLEDVASTLSTGQSGPLGTITGPDSVCTLQDTATYTLNLSSPTGSPLQYYWFAPVGWRILSGQSTKTITVVADSATEGFVSVFAVGFCICNYSCMPVKSKDCGNIGPLPVQLTSFSAKRNASNVNLSWTTASELNNREFVIERSFNGKTFNAIGSVAGNGTATRANTYSFTDTKALAGVSYYRLKQIDLDGKFEYSPVRAVSAAATALELSAYPNPTSSSVQLSLPSEATGMVRVMSLTGQTVFEGSAAQLAAKNNTLDLSKFQAGTYLVTFTNGNQTAAIRINKL